MTWCLQMSHRLQGLMLMAAVFVVVIVVLTIVQAVEGEWFIYSSESLLHCKIVLQDLTAAQVRHCDFTMHHDNLKCIAYILPSHKCKQASFCQIIECRPCKQMLI